MIAEPIENLEKTIRYRFKNRELIVDALTHSSAGGRKNYERLEFLGDRVLGLVMAGLLFEKFPAETEGDLAKRLAALVQGELLAEIAADIELGRYVILSDAEAGAGGAENENILADVFESVLGALYLDAGFEQCRTLVLDLWNDYLFEMKSPPQHPKTILQEWAQGQGLPLPTYKIMGQQGPDHAPVFEVQLAVKGYFEVTAHGRSRQAAEKEAALKFLSELEKRNS